MSAPVNVNQILALLAKGQAHMRMITRETGIQYVIAGEVVRKLVRQHQVVILGSAEEAGYTDIRCDAPVYGLPGTRLVRLAAPTPVDPRKGKSGVIAGPITIGRGYRWGAGLA